MPATKIINAEGGELGSTPAGSERAWVQAVDGLTDFYWSVSNIKLFTSQSPALITPNLGTPTAGVLTNCIGLPTAGLLDDAVTFDKFQNISNDNFLGRSTAGAGSVESLSAVQARTILNVADGADVTNAASVAAAGAAMEGGNPTFGNITASGNIIVSGTVDGRDIAADGATLDALSGTPVSLQGTWAANAGTFPGGGTAAAGYSYIVSVSGTVDGIEFTANDRIVAITGNASTTTYAGNWHKLDYTDEVQSVAGKTGAVTLVPADVGLGNVENVALSTWAGSSNIVTVGTVTAGNVDAAVSPATTSLAGKLEIATPAEIYAGTANKAHTADAVLGAISATPAALTSTAAAIAINLDNHFNFTHTTTEDTTLSLPTGGAIGVVYRLEVTQGTPVRTMGLNGAFRFVGGAWPGLTAVVGALDRLWILKTGASTYDVKLDANVNNVS